MRRLALIPLLLITAVTGHVLTGATLVVAGLAAWVSTNPVSVETALPDIQALIPAPYTMDVERLELEFGTWPALIQVVAHGVEMGRDTDRVAIARIPALQVGLDLPSLAQGAFRPTTLIVQAPALLVTRGEDGRLSAGLRAAGPTGGEAGGDAAAESQTVPAQPVLPEVTDVLSPLTGNGGPLSRLRQVEIRDATVIYIDRWHDFSWHIPDLQAVLRRTGEGLTGNLDFSLPDAGAQTRVSANFAHPGDGPARVQATVADVVPARLAAIDPVMAPLVVLESPVSLAMDLRLTSALLPMSGLITAAGRDVLLNAPDLYGRPVTLAGLDAAVAVDFQSNTLEVTEALIDLGGPRVDGGARVAWDADTIRMVADATVTDLPMPLLPVWWPPTLNDIARSWVEERMRDGTVIAASLGLETEASTETPLAVSVADVNASILFDDLSVDYLPGLPPVTGIDGSATFDGTNLTFAIDGAALTDIAIGGGVVDIFGFDTPPEDITIDLDFAGPVGSALSVIDNAPLQYAQAIGLVPATVQGAADGTIAFDFPLSVTLTVDDVNVAVDAAVVGGTIAGLLNGADVGGLDGRLRVDQDGLRYTGQAAIGDGLVQADWSESFSVAAVPRRTLNLAGTLDIAGLEAFLPGLTEFASGPVAVTAAIEDSGRGPLTIDLTADLTAAEIALAAAEVAKPPGVAGTLAGRIARLDDGSWQIAPLQVALPDLALDGSVALDADGAFARADLAPLTLHGQTARVQVAQQATGYTVGLVADRLDLSDYFGGDDPIGPARADAGRGGASAPPDQADPDDPTIWLTARVGEVLLGGSQPLVGVQADATVAGSALRGLDLDATVGGAPLVLRFGPMGDGRRQFSLQADDAGAVMEALDLVSGAIGGRLLVTATEAAAVWNGRLRLEAFQLIEAPLLARVLATRPLIDLGQQFTNQGLAFDVVDVAFALTDDRVELTEVRARGGALGFTAAGAVDRTTDSVNLQGTIVPFAGVNGLIGDIPVLGTLLTGGDDQGLLALTFEATGALDDPQISVNPLSALAPGILRRVLFEGDWDPDTATASQNDVMDR